MTNELNIEQRKALANGRDREKAVAIIVPRILGAVETAGRYVRAENGMLATALVARSDEFFVLAAMLESVASIHFTVGWAGKRVMAGELHSDRGGTYFDKRVRLHEWKRGPWQTALFDAFPADSYRLLMVPVEIHLSPVQAAFYDLLEDRRPPPYRVRYGSGLGPRRYRSFMRTKKRPKVNGGPFPPVTPKAFF